YKYMKHNMGNADRIIRVLIAVLIAVLYFTNTVSGTLGYVLLAVGAIFLLTSLVGSCPLYSLFGITTCKAKRLQ
ncbi:MAG: DUF2892 domain-containing protein, partial [Bacteroidota bacterium]|nr:DUF2892 domain-containing protein [Bacteroidota bacterium]